MHQNDEQQSSSGVSWCETESRTQSLTNPSLHGLSSKQLFALVKLNMRAWSDLIVDTALATNPSDFSISRQYKRRLRQAQYKHMLSALKQITDPRELILLLEQSGFVEELGKASVNLEDGDENSKPSKQPSKSSEQTSE